jgi:Domain of unknown function (DUF222)
MFMTPEERFSLIDGIDVEHAGTGVLASGFTNIRLIRGYLDAKEAEFARRQDLLAATVGARPAADALAQANKTTRRTAERAAARAATLGDTPELAKHLIKGNISGEHVDVLTNAAKGLDTDRRAELLDLDGELALAAASKTPEQFGRHVRKTIHQLSDDDGITRSEQQRDEACLVLGINEATGMGEIRGQLHPDDWQKVNRRIDAEIAALLKTDAYKGKSRAQLAAIALVSLVCSTRTASRVPAEVAIHIGIDSINGVPGAPRFGEYIDGTPVPAATVRRYACDANIIPIVLNGDGIPLDVGRAQRLATPTQRAALRAMYRTCAVHGCNTSFDRCEIHHTQEWAEHRGPTDLKYLIPGCSYHHHRFHEGRWQLQLDPTPANSPSGTPTEHCTPDPDPTSPPNTTPHKHDNTRTQDPPRARRCAPA